MIKKIFQIHSTDFQIGSLAESKIQPLKWRVAMSVTSKTDFPSKEMRPVDSRSTKTKITSVGSDTEKSIGAIESQSNASYFLELKRRACLTC